MRGMICQEIDRDLLELLGSLKEVGVAALCIEAFGTSFQYGSLRITDAVHAVTEPPQSLAGVQRFA